MKTFTESEEKKMETEIEHSQDRSSTIYKIIFLLIFLVVINLLFGDTSLSNAQPKNHFQSLEAKEIPGAGWSCDNCGMFQCHGQRCVHCGAKRK